MKKKRFLLVFCLVLGTLSVYAQSNDHEFQFTEASDLTLIGKIVETSNPYHRVDTSKYLGFHGHENEQVRCSAGLAVLFKTDSKRISVQTDYGYIYWGGTTRNVAYRGYDLYIKKNDDWMFAGSGAASPEAPNRNNILIWNMDGSMHECMIYLPLYAEENSIKIGTQTGSIIEPLESPFRHRIGIFGSSFTHGISAGRPGMCYPSQFTRHTGIQMLSLGCSGNCKLQDYFADVICDAEIDALVLDSFSNPSIEQIEDRLYPFIEKIQAAHPGMPIIFQATIYREGRNFDVNFDKKESERYDYVEAKMKEVVKKYKDVYFIHPNASDKYGDTSIDGTHPSNYGYTLWSESIEKPILKILKRYGIR